MVNNNTHRIVVVAWEEKTSKAIKGQIDSLFGDYLDVSCYSLKQWMDSSVDTDLVLVSTGVFANQVASKVKQSTRIIVIRRTLLKKGWNKVLSLPPGEKYMLVSDGRDFAIEAISLIYELGARYIELVPVFPGLKDIPKLKTAITPGEAELVPEEVQHVVDIGDRVIDVSTCVEVLNYFDLLNITEIRAILASYTDKIVSRNQGLQETMNNLVNIKSFIQQALDIVQEGIVIYDDKGIVANMNKEAESILGVSSWDIIGRRVEELIKEKGISDAYNNDEARDTLINIRQQNIVFNKTALKNNNKHAGGVLSLKVANRVQELELKLRSQVRFTGHEAKYSFRHIISKSEKMRKLIQHAQLISASELNVLLTGESGTGKELFAHAIHDASPRKNYPFVVVNCCALPDSLLESELFGYEEGAFTGAKKGGRQGFFEQAHNGTIFLDEIGDISPKLQSRLLRVIQQKEVIKVGGTKIFPVNVRVITATNRSLSKLLEEGKFRDDLFYRLKVAQIDIISLRERREDIPYLVEAFLEQEDFKGHLADEVMDLIIDYDWPGNIRELENTIKYLATINRHASRINGSPFVVEYFKGLKRGGRQAGVGKYHTSSWDLENMNLPQECIDLDLHKHVLVEICRARENGANIGRRSLVSLLKGNGLTVSEKRIRDIIKDLEEKGLVEVLRGRGGCQVTRKGLSVLRETPNGLG